ncbi:hypothetical protein SELMODRAFT_421581 [Selaginella moellendorffii]|uniref:DRBM domain-containing protein n=1 Tax=Selaginella moellendorffii TaxID=88036 RepID=D8SFQ3_SELML|nr:hypothetical protein SELMODRAFT_421581 [Selaginella moellendorffii]
MYFEKDEFMSKKVDKDETLKKMVVDHEKTKLRLIQLEGSIIQFEARNDNLLKCMTNIQECVDNLKANLRTLLQNSLKASSNSCGKSPSVQQQKRHEILKFQIPNAPTAFRADPHCLTIARLDPCGGEQRPGSLWRDAHFPVESKPSSRDETLCLTTLQAKSRSGHEASLGLEIGAERWGVIQIVALVQEHHHPSQAHLHGEESLVGSQQALEILALLVKPQLLRSNTGCGEAEELVNHAHLAVPLQLLVEARFEWNGSLKTLIPAHRRSCSKTLTIRPESRRRLFRTFSRGLGSGAFLLLLLLLLVEGSGLRIAQARCLSDCGPCSSFDTSLSCISESQKSQNEMKDEEKPAPRIRAEIRLDGAEQGFQAYVNGVKYESEDGFPTLKAAEHSAAKKALDSLTGGANGTSTVAPGSSMTGLCKNVLQESKREAEVKAARTAILAIKGLAEAAPLDDYVLWKKASESCQEQGRERITTTQTTGVRQQSCDYLDEEQLDLFVFIASTSFWSSLVAAVSRASSTNGSFTTPFQAFDRCNRLRKLPGRNQRWERLDRALASARSGSRGLSGSESGMEDKARDSSGEVRGKRCVVVRVVPSPGAHAVVVVAEDPCKAFQPRSLLSILSWRLSSRSWFLRQGFVLLVELVIFRTGWLRFLTLLEFQVIYDSVIQFQSYVFTVFLDPRALLGLLDLERQQTLVFFWKPSSLAAKAEKCATLDGDHRVDSSIVNQQSWNVREKIVADQAAHKHKVVYHPLVINLKRWTLGHSHSLDEAFTNARVGEYHLEALPRSAGGETKIYVLSHSSGEIGHELRPGSDHIRVPGGGEYLVLRGGQWTAIAAAGMKARMDDGTDVQVEIVVALPGARPQSHPKNETFS